MYKTTDIWNDDELLKRVLLTIQTFPVPDLFALRKQYGKDNAAFIAEQLDCVPRARAKVPEMLERQCLYTRRALEQASSGPVSNFKSALFCGKQLLSLSGGLGVDDLAFAKSFEAVISLDPNGDLNHIARYNFARMGAMNIQRLDETAENYLGQTKEFFDVIYADPDRRAEGKRESFNARAYLPDIFELYKAHAQKGGRWLVKLSPMVDPAWIRKEFGVPCRIYMVAWKRELKELLVEVDAPDENIVVETWEGEQMQWKGEAVEGKPSEKEMIFIPSSGVVKAGLLKDLGSSGLTPLNPENSLFSGIILLPFALGRGYELVDAYSGSVNGMAKFLRGCAIQKANVIAKNFVLKAPELIKRMKLEEGGEIYLVFGKDAGGAGFVKVCRSAECN